MRCEKNLGSRIITLTVFFSSNSSSFLELMRHIDDVVGNKSVLSPEFKSSAVRRILSLCFWEGKKRRDDGIDLP